jgi:hypothetical protein
MIPASGSTKSNESITHSSSSHSKHVYTHFNQLKSPPPMKTLHILSKPLQTSPFFPAQRLKNRSLRRKFMMTSSLLKEPRRFAPLKEGAEQVEGVPKLRGIVFDVDGTLW